MSQAAENLKAADETQQRLSNAMKKHAELTKELKASKAALQLKSQQLDSVSADLEAARKQLQVCIGK